MNELFSFLTFGASRCSKNTEKELLNLLYSNLNRSLVAIFLNATLFAVVMWPVVNHPLLVSWYLALLAINIGRYFDASSFSKNYAAHSNTTWYQRRAIGVWLSALSWGVIILLFFPENQLEYQMIVITLIVGMSVGAVAVLTADMRMSLIYILLLLVPLEYQLFCQEGRVYSILFLMLLLLIVTLAASAYQFHIALKKTYDTLTLYRLTQEKLTESEEKLRMIFDQTPVGIFYYDKNLTIIECNTAFSMIQSASREELLGMDLLQLPDQSLIPIIRNVLTAGIQTKEGLYYPVQEDLAIWIKLQCAPVIDSNNKVIGGVGIMEDKTQEQAARQQADFLSLNDSLTMLPNRKLFKECVRQSLKEGKRNQKYSAILFLDLDHFKQVNDSFGHDVGDKLLVRTARLLENMLRQSDTLSRFGGDEYVVLLPQLSEDKDVAMQSARKVAEKIHNTLAEPYVIDQNSLYTTGSIGIVLSDLNACDAEELLRQADIAMYQAKDEGRNGSCFYDSDMDEKAKAYFRMQGNLRHVIERNELSLNYQPVIRLATNEACGAEVLLRWNSAEDGPVSPVVFIPVAEKSGLLNEIGKWVIEQTCIQVRQWADKGIFSFDYVSINVSSKQFHDPDLALFILDTMKNYQIKPSWIKLEITETALIDNFDRVKEVMVQLNGEGIEFMIDDFGTGYSSLSYLKKLPFSVLKIDRAFIRDILTDKSDAALIRAMIDIAKQFNYLVVAEGIEEEEQRLKLLETDKNIYCQGYLYSKPVDAEKIVAFM